VVITSPENQREKGGGSRRGGAQLEVKRSLDTRGLDIGNHGILFFLTRRLPPGRLLGVRFVLHFLLSTLPRTPPPPLLSFKGPFAIRGLGVRHKPKGILPKYAAMRTDGESVLTRSRSSITVLVLQGKMWRKPLLGASLHPVLGWRERVRPPYFKRPERGCSCVG